MRGDPNPNDRSRYRHDVLRILRALRPGEVVSYGEVAAESGHPGTARGVGQILAHAEEDLPWWRVVQSTGHLARGKEQDQARRLRVEGVEVIDDRRVRMHPD